MRKIKVVLLLFLAVAAYSWNVAWASNSLPQKVTLTVQAINEIAIGNHITILDIKTMKINSQGVKVINAVSTYSVTTNEINKKITGVLNAALPKDTHLKISLEAPNGAKRYHRVLLTDIPTDLVTGVTRTAESEKTIFYQFSAPESFQWVTPLTQVITLTITD